MVQHQKVYLLKEMAFYIPALTGYYASRVLKKSLKMLCKRLLYTKNYRLISFHYTLIEKTIKREITPFMK